MRKLNDGKTNAQRYRERHPDRVVKAKSKYRKRHPHAARQYHLKHKFGLSLSDWDALMTAQAGLCAVCCEVMLTKGTKNHITVDHDHKTGKIRGLLHMKCNAGLGQFGDDATAMALGANYLEVHDAKAA